MPTTRKSANGSPVKVFISHAHEDRNVASKLIDFLLTEFDLHQYEIRCTSALDATSRIRPGKPITDQLRSDLKGARIVIGLLSTFGLKSIWVKFELGAAWGAKKTLIPVIGPGYKDEYDELGPLASDVCFSVDDDSIEDILLSHFQDEFSRANIGVKRHEQSLPKLIQAIDTYRQFGGISTDFSKTRVIILSPQPGELIGGDITVHFKVENMPANGHLWFGVLPMGINREFWPKQDNDRDEGIVIFKEGGKTSKSILAIRVIGVGLAGNAFIKRWDERGRKFDSFPGLCTQKKIANVDQIPGAWDLATVDHLQLDNSLFD